MSQTKSDRISESTVARIAGNILSGVLRQPYEGVIGWSPEDVTQAVGLARAIAAEVERTRPADQPTLAAHSCWDWRNGRCVTCGKTPREMEKGASADALSAVAAGLDPQLEMVLQAAPLLPGAEKTPATWRVSQTSGGFRADCTCGWSASADYRRTVKAAGEAHWRTFHVMPAGQP